MLFFNIIGRTLKATNAEHRRGKAKKECHGNASANGHFKICDEGIKTVVEQIIHTKATEKRQREKVEKKDEYRYF